MKYEIKRIVKIDFKIDSSEAIMFNKGGSHTCKLTKDQIYEIGKCEELQISFQLDPADKSRGDWIASEAQKAHDRRLAESGTPISSMSPGYTKGV